MKGFLGLFHGGFIFAAKDDLWKSMPSGSNWPPWARNLIHSHGYFLELRFHGHCLSRHRSSRARDWGADTMDRVVENAPPGRYRIERLSLDPVTGDIRTWKWGAVSKDRKGAIKMLLPPSTD
jgi:hypothetical protein